MKLIITLGFLVCFCGASFASYPEEISNARLDIAKRWIRSLGVEYDGEISEDKSIVISDAFAAWINGEEKRTFPKDAPAFRALVPTAWDRTRRITTLSAERLGTQNYVYVANSNPLGKPPDFLPNPNHGLYSIAASFNPGEFYVGPSDRAALCTTVKDVWQIEGRAIDRQFKCNTPAYISASRTKDVWGRVALSLSVSFTSSQLPRYQAGTILASGDPAAKRGWNKAVSGTFDPILLFRSASDWQSVGEYYAKSGFKIQSDLLPKLCQNLDSKKDDDIYKSGELCFERIAKSTIGHRVLTSLLPKVTVKTYTPFDFVKTGTTFAEPPTGGRALYDVNLSWDLKKVVPSASTRVAALKAYSSMRVKPKIKADESTDWKLRVKAHYEALACNPKLAAKAEWWDQFTMLILSKP